MFGLVAKHLTLLCVFAAIIGLQPGMLASAAATCDPLLARKQTALSATLQLNGGERATREIAIPEHSQALVLASETGLDITLEAVSAGRVIGRSASPVERTGIARLVLDTQLPLAASLVVTAKGDPGVRGQVAIRVFLLNGEATNDRCLRAQILLASGDSHYARAQAVTADDNSNVPKTDAAREYKAATDQYLAASEQASEPELQAYAEHALAAVLDDDWLQDWTAARNWARKAAIAYEHEGDPYGEARARAIEANAAMEVALTLRAPAAELGKARDELLSLATFHGRRGESLDQAFALNDVGTSYYYEGLDDEAIRSYREALRIFERLGEERWKTIMLQDIAVADMELGRVYDAIAQYDRLLRSMPVNADPSVRAMILNNSALANWQAGNMDVALRQYADALQLEVQRQNTREQAFSLLGIGSVYDTLGDSDRALDYYRRSLSLRAANLDPRGRAASLRRTANVLRSRGQVKEALAMDFEALQLASTPAQRAPIQIQRARDLEALGENDSALPLLESVIHEKNTGRKVIRAQARLERARIRISSGKWLAAEADLRSAIATFAASESAVDEFASWVALAQAQHERGSTHEALHSLAHALKLAEEVRLQSASPELRASLLEPLRPAFDLEIALLAEKYSAASQGKRPGIQEQIALEALRTAEQGRARAFADIERFDLGVSPVQSHLLEKRRALYRELRARYFQLESRRDQTADDDEHIRGILSDISGLRVQLDETDAQINGGATSQGARTVRESWILDRRGIPADTAIVEYWLGAEKAIAWVVTRDALALVDLGRSATITEAAHAFHDSLRAFGAVPVAARLEDGARLYALSIQPLERYIAPYHTLIFAPDGALHYIPFGALRATGPDGSRFLVEKHDVAVTPSIKILLNRSAKGAVTNVKADRVLVLADPVYAADDTRLRATGASHNANTPQTDIRPSIFRSAKGTSLQRLIYTAPEAAAIASLVPPGHVDRLEGFEATKDHFLAAPFDRYRVIHIASHATTDARIPGLSALALSAFDPTGKKIDDLVFAADFMTLRLSADLVVLSACDTALGKDVAGEGLMGLRYITLARGAHTVVASLWEVPDDATSELMIAFYRSFLGGHKSVPAALSDAMRTMLKGSRTDPSEWGSFNATISAPENPR